MQTNDCFWSEKGSQTEILKIIEWAQKNKIKVEDVTKEQVLIAIKITK